MSALAITEAYKIDEDRHNRIAERAGEIYRDRTERADWYQAICIYNRRTGGAGHADHDIRPIAAWLAHGREIYTRMVDAVTARKRLYMSGERSPSSARVEEQRLIAAAIREEASGKRDWYQAVEELEAPARKRSAERHYLRLVRDEPAAIDDRGQNYKPTRTPGSPQEPFANIRNSAFRGEGYTPIPTLV